MPGWVTRLALVVLSVVATACAGGTIVGAAAAETHVTELLVTCLSCGEQWLYAPSATIGAGLLSLFTRRRLADRCPKCKSRAVVYGHAHEHAKSHQGRTA